MHAGLCVCLRSSNRQVVYDRCHSARHCRWRKGWPCAGEGKHPHHSAPDRGAEYCDECVCVCVCVCLCVCDHIFGTTLQSSPKFLCMLPMAVAPFSFGGIVIRYVRWHPICSYAKVAQRRCPAEAQCTCSLGLGYKLCTVIPVAGQRTHGTFWVLKVTSQVATPVADSAVSWLPSLFMQCNAETGPFVTHTQKGVSVPLPVT